MKKNIEVLIESIENNNIETLNTFIKFNDNTCCAYKNSQNKNIQCPSKKINNTLFCGRHKSFFSRDKKLTHYLEIIKQSINDNKELIKILKFIHSNHNDVFLNNLSNQDRLSNDTIISSKKGDDNDTNLNEVINLLTSKYVFFDLHQIFSEAELEILNKYHNLDNNDYSLVTKKLKEIDYYQNNRTLSKVSLVQVL